MNNYSFKDTSGAMTHPLTGPFSFFGQIGVGRFSVEMATDRTAHNTAADGNVMVSYLTGNSGSLDVEVQQNSALHIFLLSWLNLCITAADGGDQSNWATMAITLRNITTKTYHTLTGVSPGKMPSVPYAAQGQTVTWKLMAANIVNG